MSLEHLDLEQRRFPRVPFRARANVLRKNRWLGGLAVENLSQGGAYLSGNAGLALGERVTLAIHEAELGRVILTARVVRHDRSLGHSGFAVEFRMPSERTSGRIRSAIRRRLSQELAQRFAWAESA